MSDPAISDKSRKFRGRTSEERKDERRGRFIEAGLETFGREGFHATGVREICAQAGLTERYFYESFPNREALFLAVYEHSVTTIRTATRAAIARSSRDVYDMAPRALRAFFET